MVVVTKAHIFADTFYGYGLTDTVYGYGLTDTIYVYGFFLQTHFEKP